MGEFGVRCLWWYIISIYQHCFTLAEAIFFFGNKNGHNNIKGITCMVYGTAVETDRSQHGGRKSS